MLNRWNFLKTGFYEGIKFSFQYTVAAALLDGAVTIGSFADERRFALDMEDLLGKIDLNANAEIPVNFEEMWSSVEVLLDDGKRHSVRCDRPRGIWGNPLSREERLAKFRSCASRAVSPDVVERCIEIVENLENARNLHELIYLMGATNGAPSSSGFTNVLGNSANSG